MAKINYNNPKEKSRGDGEARPRNLENPKNYPSAPVHIYQFSIMNNLAHSFHINQKKTHNNIQLTKTNMKGKI